MRFWVFIISLLPYYLIGQQPSHYRIGEDQFSGIDIYDLYQDKNDYIWISSNDGLYSYDGYQFTKFANTQMKNRSLFNIVEDKNGAIYCNNLYGQIFKVVEDSLKLIYTVPDSLKYENVYYNIDDQNNIVFASNGVYRVENNEPVFLKSNNKFACHIPKSSDGELAIYSGHDQKIYYLKNGEIRLKPQSEIPLESIFNSLYIYLDIKYGNEYFHEHRSTNLFRFQNNQWEQIINEEENTEYNTLKWIFLKNCILRASFNGGANAFDLNGNPLFDGNLIFPNFQLSCGFVDREGNIWLGTLGKGMIIVPNLNIIDFKNHPLLRDDDLLSITSDENGNIYVGGFSGNVYQFKENQVQTLVTNNFRVEFLQYVNANDHLLLGQNKYDLSKDEIVSNRISSVKGCAQIGPTEFLMATNVNLKYLSIASNPFLNAEISQFKNLGQDPSKLYEFNLGRCTTVAYDKDKNEIWAGTSSGVKLIKTDTIISINKNEEPIAAINIELSDKQVWIATPNNGILIFENYRVVDELNDKNGLLSNEIITMKKNDDLMLIATKKGLVIRNLKNHETSYMTIMQGLNSNRILDLELVGDKLWLINGETIQIIGLKDILNNNTKPQIEIRSIKVNDEEIDPSKSEFDYNEDQFEFHFVSIAFRHRGTMTYQYRLEGVDENWQTTNYLNNSIRYTSIPPGEYAFTVKSVNTDGISSNPVEYKFKIAAPFWSTWWFYSLCIIGVILIIAGYFLIRLSIVKKRLQLEKQLKASEVTAIKAQMNPHFVFNALNSVQDLIMQNDIRESNIYLGKFADLMRKTLDYSGKDKISLREEINLLKLYLDLEKLRFGEDFIFELSENLGQNDADEIMIPPMLLQPYIENAIKHGLLHKEGDKRLSINFSVNNSHLICVITDNGIGRKKSSEIKDRQSYVHNSFASEAIQKRLDLVNTFEDQKITLEISDIDTEGTGTKVVVKFPI
ncbi:histidine kinase [Paracrocinitomix mangrovi]|uniref:sensor histidine kinase n=1 Tax=Paracrocinitomix mangrovi TaxID=2862509 RepID=UPI001C8E8CF0|nr:histidine kinase [Paracrocinitomix mangrovi]UKN03508.1 histidine kinase [Paracrocinitomix mangrovi]